MVIGTVFYLLLDFAFVGSLNPANLVHGWTQPIPGVAKLGPYISLTTQAGLGWLATLLVIDAVVSPGGTGLVYLGTSSRLSYGLGRNGYFPKIISRINARGVPIVSIAICFVIGMLTFLPFPDWFGLVGLITSATVIMYAMAPLALAGLRKQDPDRPRGYRLPAAAGAVPARVHRRQHRGVRLWVQHDLLAGRCSSLVGFIIFGLYQVSLPAEKRTILDLRSASWLVPWLAALLIISWLGRYDGSPPKVFGLTLLATHRLGEWWDLLAVAGMSLVVYYWATNSCHADRQGPGGCRRGRGRGFDRARVAPRPNSSRHASGRAGVSPARPDGLVQASGRRGQYRRSTRASIRPDGNGAERPAVHRPRAPGYRTPATSRRLAAGPRA